MKISIYDYSRTSGVAKILEANGFPEGEYTLLEIEVADLIFKLFAAGLNVMMTHSGNDITNISVDYRRFESR